MGLKLPKFRWFQTRPKVAWCCRWVMGGAAVLALAAWVFTIWGRMTWCVPQVAILELHTGRVALSDDPGFTGPHGLIRPSDFADEGLGVYWRHERAKKVWGPRVGEGLPYSISTAFFPWPDMNLQTHDPTTGECREIVCPLWLIFGVTTPPALAAWRNRWVVRREVGVCRACGYSRDGLAGGVACPECGKVPRA